MQLELLEYTNKIVSMASVELKGEFSALKEKMKLIGENRHLHWRKANTSCFEAMIYLSEKSDMAIDKIRLEHQSQCHGK